MHKTDNHQRHLRFVRQLCRHRAERDIEAAEDTFRNYLRTAWSIFERLEQERAERRNPQPPTRQPPDSC
jgi:ribosomal 50S subunit-associated protein YjgA (DUF615 family)